MYSISDIKKGIRNPELAKEEIRSRFYPLLHPVRTLKSGYVSGVQRYTYYRSGYDYNPEGVDIFAKTGTTWFCSTPVGTTSSRTRARFPASWNTASPGVARVTSSSEGTSPIDDWMTSSTSRTTSGTRN